MLMKTQRLIKNRDEALMLLKGKEKDVGSRKVSRNHRSAAPICLVLGVIGGNCRPDAPGRINGSQFAVPGKGPAAIRVVDQFDAEAALRGHFGEVNSPLQ